MTNTATPERVTKIAAPGDRVIILSGTFDGHMATIKTVSIADGVSVILDVTGQVGFYNRDELVYPTGEHLESCGEQSARETRARTSERLHRQTVRLRPIRSGDREAAIMMMAARYGAAERLNGDSFHDLDLSYRAAHRRFAALQRLVYGD